MLKITKTAPNRVDLTLSGKIETEEMRKGLDDLITLSEGVKGGVMLYRIPDFAMPSFGAIGVEMARLPALFGLLNNYDRCAVLTDASWLKSAAEMKGSLFGGIDIKAFDLDQEEAAEAWLAEAPASAPA
ncbi:STAS/SEC14 domain-containing protein [Thalassobius sp. MITS945101]|uniref:STAS/SEC14 domain-containing protein n=1 Tax=Thalassobius sp. MITS945101 TaxID=3096994 RepID=UPI00399A947D